MAWTRILASNTLTLEEVIDRLGRHDVVEGILLIGSTGQSSLSVASDYDLVVVLSEMPVPLHVALTVIDRRLTDVIFLTAYEVDRLAADGKALALDGWEARLVRWLQGGRVAYDRTGRLDQAQRRAREASIEPAGEGDWYGAWFGINYNVKQTQRMVASPDPVYQMAVDLRLLYSLAEVWTGYFRFRNLPWQGEKEAIRYLAAHDPAYLALFQRCLAETDRTRKVQMYTELAGWTLAPVGGLWPEGSTAIQVSSKADWQPDLPTIALDFWQRLLADS